MSETTQLQVQELARFAQEQDFNQQYRQYFGDVWEEAGVENISQMTVQDAEQTLKILADSEASPQFIKSLLAQAAIDGATPQVLEYFLSSDIDSDGRTLAQEIFQDGTNPLEPRLHPSHHPRHRFYLHLQLKIWTGKYSIYSQTLLAT